MVPHGSFFRNPLNKEITAFLKILKVFSISGGQLILGQKNTIHCGLPIFGTLFGIFSINGRDTGFFNKLDCFPDRR